MTSNYMPFFREGRLCLPQAICQLLVESGSDADLIKRACKGLHLDDDRQYISNIHQQLLRIASTLEPEVQAILTSPDMEYMLTYNHLEDIAPV